ncbi:MAG: TM0996/MTH895 family glutaredoxin-like protein [Proteobacteria bacterium]|nr:TM0996/MTH895 family glutaredoxin-like protein [Pseudomonadota bacterium]
MEIKVLGPGCAKCHKTEEIVRAAVQESGVEVHVIKVSDAMEIAKSGVFGTPAVIVDGQVKAVGKIPSKQDVLNWIGK